MRKGFITISRPSFSEGKEAIVLRIGDEASRSGFLEVHVGYREFTLALTGQGHIPCAFEIDHLDRIGKIYETKTEQVPVPRYGQTSQSAELLAPFEVDGWVGNPNDLVNHHRRRQQEDGTSFAAVTFVRYVDPP